MERFSPIEVDAKALRREPKRAAAAAAVDAQSPTKKVATRRKPIGAAVAKPTKATKVQAAASTSKRKHAQNEVAALQDVVDGIQQQVDAATRGIQELRELVGSHMQYVLQDNDNAPVCVSPPASLLAFEADQEVSADGPLDELTDFAFDAQHTHCSSDATTFRATDSVSEVPFSC